MQKKSDVGEILAIRSIQAGSIFLRETIGTTKGVPVPVFTFDELIRWAKKQKSMKYKRLYTAKRYVSIVERAKSPRTFCSRKRLRSQCRCSVLVETSGGKTLVSPTPAEVEAWLDRSKQSAFIDAPPCPVQLLEGHGCDVAIHGFCSISFSVSPDTVRQNDKVDYVLHDDKAIRQMQQAPTYPLDALEPRPWLSWSDLFIKDRRDPSSPFDAIDEEDEQNAIPVSEVVLFEGDLSVYIKQFAEIVEQRYSKRKTWLIKLLPLLNRIEPIEESFSEIHAWTILTLMSIEESEYSHENKF